MRPLISFCIPTLNFGRFIGQTLQSIVDQADERVQIVVVDGGSTDDTAAIVADAASRFPRIKFIQREKRHGIDLDILESVTQADGEYCWLFSSDDVLAPNAVARAMTAIDAGGWDVFLVGMTLCDLQMHPLYDHPILACQESRTFDWSDPDQRADYFRRAQTTTAFFSFISDILIRRDRWLAARTVDRFIGSCWIIAAKVAAMSQQGLRVRFDPEIYLHKRGENDSFAAQGLVRRIELSMRGFRELGCYFFGPNSFEARQISRVVSNEYPLLDLLAIKCQLTPKSSHEQCQKFYELAHLNYVDRGWLGTGQYLVLRWMPIWAMTALRPAYRLLTALRRQLGG